MVKYIVTMLSVSHIIIIVVFAIIFLGPDKIPQFFKSLAEGLLIFKNTFNNEGTKQIKKTKQPISRKGTKKRNVKKK